MTELASRETRSVACEVGSGRSLCGDTYQWPGHMAAHLARDHGSTPSVALVNARRMFGYDTLPPAPAPVFACHEGSQVTARRPIAQAAPSVRQPSTPRAREPRQRVCKFCVRMQAKYGQACKHHGGPSHHGNVMDKRTVDTCGWCIRMTSRYGTPCRRHGGPSHGPVRVAPGQCFNCSVTREKYQTPCKRHGGPPRGTDSYSKRLRREAASA